MKERLALRFLDDDTAAVAVDWTVVSAACVGLSLSAVIAIRNGAVPLGQTLTDASVVALNFSGEQAEPFVFVPYRLRPDQIAFYVDYYSDPAQSGSDEYVTRLHEIWAEQLMAAYAADDQDGARRYIDAVYTVHEGLEQRGLTPPGDMTMQEYVDMFDRTFG